VTPARLLVAVDEHVVRGLEEEDAMRGPAGVELVEHARQLLEVLARAHVRYDGGPVHLAAVVLDELGERGDHLRRQVVDAEVPRILEARHGLRLPGAREPCDQDEVVDGHHF
jgi:hypothetical protein